MRKFKKVAMLDPVILYSNQWEELGKMTGELRDCKGGRPNSLDLYLEADRSNVPMCWTQLSAREYTEAELEDATQGADAIISCWTNLPESVLRKNSRNQGGSLEYIGYWTNLAAHRTNMELAKEQGIHVDYVPDYGTKAVAEMTLTGILSVLRNFPQNTIDTARGKWVYELLKTGKRDIGPQDIPQESLWEKKVGIVGFGRIGQTVAKLVKPFDTVVNYYSRSRRLEAEKELSASYLPLDDLFEQSDIVTVHIDPYAPEKIVTANHHSKIRDGGIFVNTSAGRLIDQEALFNEIRSGRIRAYLDVYENLPPRQLINGLKSSGNCFTYRAAWFTKETVEYKGNLFLNNIRNYLEK